MVTISLPADDHQPTDLPPYTEHEHAHQSTQTPTTRSPSQLSSHAHHADGPEIQLAEKLASAHIDDTQGAAQPAPHARPAHRRSAPTCTHAGSSSSSYIADHLHSAGAQDHIRQLSANLALLADADACWKCVARDTVRDLSAYVREVKGEQCRQRRELRRGCCGEGRGGRCGERAEAVEGGAEAVACPARSSRREEKLAARQEWRQAKAARKELKGFLKEVRREVKGSLRDQRRCC